MPSLLKHTPAQCKCTPFVSASELRSPKPWSCSSAYLQGSSHSCLSSQCRNMLAGHAAYTPWKLPFSTCRTCASSFFAPYATACQGGRLAWKIAIGLRVDGVDSEMRLR